MHISICPHSLGSHSLDTYSLCSHSLIFHIQLFSIVIYVGLELKNHVPGLKVGTCNVAYLF